MEKRLAKTRIAAVILLIWGAMSVPIIGAFARFERPIFAIYKTTADDGVPGQTKG